MQHQVDRLSMYLYRHIDIYIYMCVCVYVAVCIYIYIYVYVAVCICIYVWSTTYRTHISFPMLLPSTCDRSMIGWMEARCCATLDRWGAQRPRLQPFSSCSRKKNSRICGSYLIRNMCHYVLYFDRTIEIAYMMYLVKKPNLEFT